MADNLCLCDSHNFDRASCHLICPNAGTDWCFVAVVRVDQRGEPCYLVESYEGGVRDMVVNLAWTRLRQELAEDLLAAYAIHEQDEWGFIGKRLVRGGFSRIESSEEIIDRSGVILTKGVTDGDTGS